MSARHGPDEECPACYECPGCSGASGSWPERSYLRVEPGVTKLICSDCNGDGVLCPNYDPAMRATT